MAESNKGSVADNKAWLSEQEIVEADVADELSDKEKDREKDISDEVSFHRQTKFSETDAKDITEKALGDSALKRPDKLGVYKEISTLSPDIQNLWEKTENKRITGKSQINYARNLLKKEGIAEQEKMKLESDINALDERDAAFEDIGNIILKEKNPNEISKAIQNLLDAYKINQREFQKQIKEQSGNIRAQAGLQRLNIGINILLNFKNAVSKIINAKEKNMTSKESSIIDSELKIDDPIEGGGVEQKKSLQEVIEVSESEIVNTQGDIQAEAGNNNANIKQKSEGIKDPLVKDQIRTDAQKSNNEVVSNGIRISKKSLEKLNGIKNGQKPEAEAKNPEIQALQNRADEELRSTQSALSIFEKGKSDERDLLVDRLIREGKAKESKNNPGGTIKYLEKKFEDEQKILYYVKAQIGLSKSSDEFQNKIRSYLESLQKQKKIELEGAEKNKKDPDPIEKKYSAREGVLKSYLPSIKEVKPEPKADSGSIQSEPKIEVKPVDIKSDIQPNQDKQKEISSAIDQKIENLRLGVAEQIEAGNKDEANRLVSIIKELEREKSHNERTAAKKQGKDNKSDIKPQVQNKDAQAAKDKITEPKNYDQELQSLREQIKQAEKQAKELGDQSEVLKLEEELYKLEQEQRNEKALAGEKDKEKQRSAKEKNNETQKQDRLREAEQRIADLRVEIIAAEKADNNDKVVELENALREVQKEQRHLEGKEDNKEVIPDIKEFSNFEGMQFKQWDKIKVRRTSGAIEDDWSVGFIDRKEGLVKVFKDGSKRGEMIEKWIPITELAALNLIEPKDNKGEDKKEEPASAEATASKEKTAEEILREKNIEVYGGEEKLNQIFEDYKRLNELEDRGAYFKEHPLFSEWDALRVKIASINLEVIEKDRVVNLYKIQNKDEKIREYFNTKLDEPFESFKKDIEKESPAEWAMRAATLIKYRNELKNCDWQKKDKYRDIPREKYVEIIKWLEQRIGMLNEKLPKKEGVSSEAALKDMSIDDYNKIEKDPEYKGGLPAVIEGEKVRTEMTAEQTAKVETILKEFNLTAEDAEKIEGFKDLSYGQRLLALENLRQLTLRDVRIGSVKKQKEEAGQAQGFWKKMWTGIKKKYDIAKHEKSISQSLNKEDNLATLTQLTRGMKESKTDVIEKNGKLEFQYISGLENLTLEQAAKVQKFNEVASELSKMPMEWTADDSKKGFFRQMMDKAGLGQSWSPDDPTRGQYNRCQELTAEFQSLKQEVLQVVKQQKDADLKKGGIEKFDDWKNQSHAMAQMLQMENLLRCNRAMNVNPDAEKALMEIKSAPLWKRALNNIATEKGIYMVAGFAARTVTVTFLGTAGLVGAGAGMGGYMGYKRGKETLRENDALAQHKSFEETEQKRIEKYQRAKQGKTGPIGETEKTEKKIEDANVLARNLNNFVEYIGKEDDPKRQTDLARRLRDRVKYVKTALDEGRINFGATDMRVASLYELTDKLNDAVNCAEMYHPSTRHGADQWSEANQSKVMKKLNEYLDESKIKLSAERRKYLVKQLAKGALYGAGFVTAGMMVREVASHIDPHLFNAQGETDLGVRWISDKGGAGKPFIGGIVGKYLHGEPGSGGGGLSPHGPDVVGHGGGNGGGHIPPHDGGVPTGGGSAEKSFFGEFADDQSKESGAFPENWPMKPVAQPEIPMGQGSFAERFLRAVGIHEGSPAKPDLQKIVAEYSEYFRNHPELLKNNNSSSELLKHLKSDLQNAGLDSDAAKNITMEFNAEMGKIGTGIYPEGEALPGIDSTGGNGGAEHAAAAASGAREAAAETLVGAKQDALASAVETASGKMNSVWKMIGHQLDQRGIFKGLAGTPEEIAAKKTYMIDYFKDMVAKDPKGFGLEDIDDLRVGQKVDLSKLFESHPRLGEIIRDTNALPADKLASIFKHDQIIAEFHRLHPEVPIISENVDQIAAGHGDALLKKAVEQAASEHVQPSAPETIIQPEIPKVPHHPMNPYEDMLRNNIEGRIKEVQRLTDETVGERLNKIFDYAFGRQGADTSTYQDIKGEIADSFLKRNFSNETDINDPFAIDSDDARRYGELQQYLRELIKENHAAPRTGETVADFIKRLVSAAIRSDIGKLTESPIDPKSELI